MIVPMKKLTLLVYDKDRKAFLKRLRSMGLVHLKKLAEPAVDDLEVVEKDMDRVKQVIDITSRFDARHETPGNVTCDYKEVKDRVKAVLGLVDEKADCDRELENAKRHIGKFKAWGRFSPADMAGLAKKGIFLKLYIIPKKAFDKIEDKGIFKIVNEDRQVYYAAHVSREDTTLGFEEIKIQGDGYDESYRKIDSLKKRIEEINALLRCHAWEKDALRDYQASLETRHTFLRAFHGMKAEGTFSYLQGFCPSDRLKDIVGLASSLKIGYVVEEPSDPAETPTLIRNPKWIRIIEPVFNFMKTVPGYKEFDISGWFLVFFSVFFAMLIGDAGYGLIFILATYLAGRKFRHLAREPFRLMYLLGFTTLIWGAVTGTWFGAREIAQLPFINSLIVTNIDSFVESNQNYIIQICFIIAIIQLTIAHLAIAVRMMNSLKVISEIGWISVLWGLFFTAGALVLGKPFYPIYLYLILFGSLAVLIFTNPQKNVIKGILSSLLDVPLKVISSFADIVSYIRLFAVGYASVILASTFNELALGVGFDSFLKGFGAALILFFGHALNIILGFMSVIVHGIRLNMLEFSGQMGMQWSGREYDPFRETYISRTQIKKG